MKLHSLQCEEVGVMYILKAYQFLEVHFHLLQFLYIKRNQFHHSKMNITS